MNMLYILNFIPFAGLFYFIIIPIWLVIVTRRLNAARREIEAMRPTPQWQSRDVREDLPPVTRTPSITPSPQKEGGKSEKSFEEQVGGHWFQWLGIAALILGLIFFLKWSFDNGWIGPTGRTVLGYLFASAAIIAGDRLRTKYGIWSLAFTGGGALASYIVTWVALHKYALFDPTLAFVLYILTTTIVCLLAGYYRAIALAAFGILGGFITPWLTGEEGSIIGLLSYILILDVGVLALSHVRQWRVLNVLTFLGTISYEGWALVDGQFDRSSALLFMAAFGGIYLAVPAVYNIMKKAKSEAGDILLLLGNGLVHFGLLLAWLGKTEGLREAWDGPIALAFSLLFLVLSSGMYKQNKNDTPLVLASLSLTIFFASLAIPLQLGEVWIPLAWSLEAAFLLWIALELNDKRLQYYAWPVMGAAYFWYLFVPGNDGVLTVLVLPGLYLFLFWALLFVGIACLALERDRRDASASLLPFTLVGGAVLVFSLLFNVIESNRSSLDFLGRFIDAAAIIGGSYVVLFQARRKWAFLSADEKKGFTFLGIGVQIITLSYFTYEFVTAIEEKKIFASAARPRQIMQVGISILWALYGIVTLIVGMMRGWKSIRLFSIILLLIATGKLALVDFFDLGTGARVIGFTVLGALLVGASFLYQRNKETLKAFFVDSSPSPLPKSS